jgi:hypothetical protein
MKEGRTEEKERRGEERRGERERRGCAHIPVSMQTDMT